LVFFYGLSAEPCHLPGGPFSSTVVEPSGEAGRVETTGINLRGLDTRG
jgi:hypothetical protein